MTESVLGDGVSLTQATNGDRRMFQFEFHVPTKLVFGAGKLSQLPEAVSAYGRRVLIVLGCDAMRSHGVVGRALGLLEGAGLKVSLLEGVKSNPALALVQRGAAIARAEGTEVVVGLGGGSVMDSAKLISLAATHEDVWELRVTGSRSVPGISATLPVVTVPTTGGTGSEWSPAALLSDGLAKEVFYSPHLFPRSAVVDPALAVTLGPRLSAQIALDAFVQGMEAYVSRTATPFSDCYAVAAMRLAHESVRRVMEDGSDLEARSRVSLAGIFSLLAINQAGVGAVHALSDPLSARYDIHHGLALALVLPEVVEANFEANAVKFGTVATILGANADGAAGGKMAGRLAEAVRGFVETLGLSHRLSEFGVTADVIPTLARETQNPDMSANPRTLELSEIEAIYRKALN